MPRLPLAAGLLLLTAAAGRADKVVLVAGGGDGPDGSPALQAKVVQPFAVAFAGDGGLLFVEMAGGERLRRIAPDGTLSTLAGTGEKGDAGDGGPAPKAKFNGLHDLAVAPDGDVLLADTFNHRVRRYSPRAKSVTGLAGAAGFNQPICLAFGPGGKTLYVADIGNRRVRAVDVGTSQVATFAGTGQKGVPKDGEPAKDQPLVDPRAVAADPAGNVYVLERGGHALRVVRPDGAIRTVAGTGKKGAGGDGGPALRAAFNGPKYLAVDRDGSVLIADTENHQVRRYVPGREAVELVAGTGKAGPAGVGGDPLRVELGRPHGVAVHPTTGEVYIADSDNGRVLKIVKE